LVETGRGRKVETETNVTFGKSEGTLGDAEWAATQTVHLAASIALEWWWATNANADQIVSIRQTSATRLDHNRILATLETEVRLYTEIESKRNDCIIDRLRSGDENGPSLHQGLCTWTVPRIECNTNRGPVTHPGFINRLVWFRLPTFGGNPES
jgi:hypothetical protein